MTQSPTAGTAFVTFDNVKVPVENTLGPEGGGIFVMLRSRSFLFPINFTHPPYPCYSNFNHERWVMVCSSSRSQRLIVEECLKYANISTTNNQSPIFHLLDGLPNERLSESPSIPRRLFEASLPR
jgi:hypothetical protein